MERVLTKVLVERERIRARIARDRTAITGYCQALSGPAVVVDNVLEGVRFLRRHPLAVGGVVAAVAVLRVRSVVGLTVRGIGLWRLFRRLRRLAQTFGL